MDLLKDMLYKSYKKGFTFIELIIYVAILGIIATSLIAFAWNVVYVRLKAQAQREVTQNMRYITDKIIYEVKNAESFSVDNVNKVTIVSNDSNRNPVVIDFLDGKIRLGYGLSGECNSTNPCVISGKNIVITNLEFRDYTLSGQESMTLNFRMNIAYMNNVYKASTSYNSDLQGTVSTENGN